MTSVATVNTRRGKATPAPVADVIGHQEAKTPQARRRIRQVLHDYDHYTASENWAASLMVSWRADLYDVVPAAEWVPDLFGPKAPANVTVDGRGMSWLVVDAIAGVTPGRGWVLVLLREKATGALCFILNGHPIQSAWSKKPVMRRRIKIDGRWRWVGGKAWRREQWVRQFEVADRITRAILATGRSLVAMADWNRREVKLSGLVNPRLVTPAGIQSYDQILASPDLNPRNFRRAADTKLGSDHWPRAIDIGPKEAPVTGYYLIDHPPKQRQYRERGTTASGVVVIHTAESIPDVTGDDMGAENVARFIQQRSDFGSYHTLVDSDSVVPLIPFRLTAYGDGTGSNSHAIHLSMATKADAWSRMPAPWVENVLQNLALEAHKASDYLEELHGVRIPARQITREESDNRVEGFISHARRDPARRTDPGKDFPWDRFFELYRQLEDGPLPPKTRGEEVDKALRRASAAITAAERATARDGTKRDQELEAAIEKLKQGRFRLRQIPIINR